MHQRSVNLRGAGALEGTLEPMVVADLHQVNMFGNIEWPSTRKDPQRRNISRTLSPSFSWAPAGAPTVELSRATCLVPSPALWF